MQPGSLFGPGAHDAVVEPGEMRVVGHVAIVPDPACNTVSQGRRRAWSMSAIRSPGGSIPAESRISESGAVSPGHRLRRSQLDSTPPKLLAGRISRAEAT